MEIGKILILLQQGKRHATPVDLTLLEWLFAQELADVGPSLSNEQLYRLIAIGAILFEFASDESRASREADLVIKSVRK